jgi:acyl carrier protein
VVAALSTSHEATRTLVGCGQPLLDQQIVIVDPETSTACPPDAIGEIWVSGPSVTHGYWNQPEETTRTFHAYLSDTSEGPFLRTGDLGFLNNGHLFVVGRLKDMIVIRGRNHFPQDFELTVEQRHPALRPGCGAAFSVEEEGEEALVVVQELDYRRQPDVSEVIESIREALSEEHEVQVHAVVLIKPGTIPKTSSGKIQRQACRLMYLSTTLEVVGQWQQAPESEGAVPLDSTTPIRDAEDIQAWFKSQLAARLRVPAEEIDVTQPIARYGMDSLTAIELTHSIEARLGVILPVVSFLQSPSITQLADKVLAELRTSSATNESAIKTIGQVTIEHPLSHGQRALYFLHRLAPDSAAYNISRAVRILSPLNTAALRRAFQSLVDRHASLRTTFGVDQAGEPVQLVHEKAEVCFREEDAADWSEEELRVRLAEQANQPFDLEHGPVLRVNCYRRSASEYVMLLSVHHIVADFWSLAVLANELGISYVSEQAGTSANLPPLTVQYGDFARFQSEFLNGAVGGRLWARDRLSRASAARRSPSNSTKNLRSGCGVLARCTGSLFT